MFTLLQLTMINQLTNEAVIFQMKRRLLGENKEMMKGFELAIQPQ